MAYISLVNISAVDFSGGSVAYILLMDYSVVDFSAVDFSVADF